MNIVDISMEECLNNCIRLNGLEGTEDIIKRVYSNEDLHKTRDMFLKLLYKRYKL